MATDIPPDGESQVRLTAETQVVVTVRDVNDNAPIISSPGMCFTWPSVIATGIISILLHIDGNPIVLEILEEMETLGINLFTVTATDIDGDSDDDQIIYSLTATDNSLVCLTTLEDVSLSFWFYSLSFPWVKTVEYSNRELS